jgi:hypothetical protein
MFDSPDMKPDVRTSPTEKVNEWQGSHGIMAIDVTFKTYNYETTQ